MHVDEHSNGFDRGGPGADGMKVRPTPIAGVLVIEPRVIRDVRGFFMESHNRRDFAAATGVDAEFVQDNHSRSKRGVLRGLHYQQRHPQGKLVRVVRGAVFDVAADIRPGSPTFGHWIGRVLSATNHLQHWIAPGLAHGFLALEEDSEVLYKVTGHHVPDDERVILWNDPALGIDWPLAELGLEVPILSSRDRAGRALQSGEDEVE